MYAQCYISANTTLGRPTEDAQCVCACALGVSHPAHTTIQNRIVFEQLGQNIVSKDLTFDVGYYKGTKRVTILSADDMRDVKRLLRSTGSKVALWCMGLSTKQASVGKRTREKPNSDSEISDSDDEPRRVKTKRKSTKRSKHEEKQERIDNTIKELKAKHGTTYTNIQYRVWAESFDTRYHQNLDQPPRGSLFKSQGRKSIFKYGRPAPWHRFDTTKSGKHQVYLYTAILGTTRSELASLAHSLHLYLNT